MKKRCRRFILIGIIVLLTFSLSACTGCVYTPEEATRILEYEMQGKRNAKDYIEEKYGFEATVKEVECEKVMSHFMDFTPFPTGEVYVTMEYDDKTFWVSISGEEETTEGADNYQYEEISVALQQKLFDITELPIEGLFLRYGQFDSINDNRKGMINTYFNGENLIEVMKNSYSSSSALVSYINQDINTIDLTTVIEQTGVESYLFVDYASKEHYDIVGSPMKNGIENSMLYINEYLQTNGIVTTYRECKKTVIDDVILITEHPEEEVSIEKTTMDVEGCWKCSASASTHNEKQIFDAYALSTDSEQVEVYIPINKLDTDDLEYVSVLKHYFYNGDRGHEESQCEITSDEKYLHITIYTHSYTDIKFSVLNNEM